MTVGVLALQGDFAEHMLALRALNVSAKEVRTVADLAGVDRCILPGGESTTMGKLLWEQGLAEEIIRRYRQGTLPLYGTCAGAILIGREIMEDTRVRPLGLIDIAIERNAYGTQLQSFRTSLSVKGIPHPIHVAFIRAPKIVRTGANVEILASHDGVPVLVREGSILAGTFHPELAQETAIHSLFLSF